MTDAEIALGKIREASEWFDEQGYSLWASEMHWAHGKLSAEAEQARNALQEVDRYFAGEVPPAGFPLGIVRAALAGNQA